jgi:hypothetical protein
MALPVFTPGKVATTTKSTVKSGLPVFVRPETKLVEVKPTVISSGNTYQDLISKFGNQEISTTLKPGEMRLSDLTTKFKDQEISKPRVFEGPKLENKISENEFVMKEFQAGRANYKKNPVTGKNEITSPEIEVFRNAPDSARAVMLQAQAKESPFIKALESKQGKEITGQIVDKTSDIPLKLWAGVKTIGSLGQKSYEDAKAELIKAKEDPTNNIFQKFLYQAQDSIPQTLIGVGLMLTPGGAYTSSAYFGALSVEGERQKPGGLGDSTAGNIVIDVLGDRVLGGMAEKMLGMTASTLKGLIATTLRTGGAEGSTEVMQTFLKYANDYKEANTPEEKQAIVDETVRYIKSGDMAMEFTVGAVAGAGVGAGVNMSGGKNIDIQQDIKPAPVIEEVPPEVIGEKPASVTRAENSKLPKFEPTTKTQTQTVEEPIFTEARKYATPEEFVKAQPTVYHGTSMENANKINVEGFKTGSGKGVSGQTSNDFIYATESKVSAGKYVSDRLGIKDPTTISGSFNGKVLEIDGKMADFEAFGEASKKLGIPLGKDAQGNLSMLDMTAIKKAMQEQGYGAIRFSDRYANGSKALAIIPDQIKTKSQLTDIWNKAQQTTAPLAKGPQSMPTGTPETQPADKGLQSRVYDRIKSENPETFKDDATYEAVKLKEDLARAADLVATDKQKAYNIAMGSETSNEVLSNSVSEILFEKALDEGNLTMANTLLKNLSFRATRMGQEIVALKGSVSNNSTAQFVKELIDTRLAALGKKYLGDVTDTVKGKMKGGKESNQKRGLNKIKEEVNKVKEKIGNKKELDLAEAQSIIDKLTCK